MVTREIPKRDGRCPSLLRVLLLGVLASALSACEPKPPKPKTAGYASAQLEARSFALLAPLGAGAADTLTSLHPEAAHPDSTERAPMIEPWRSSA